MAIKKKKKKKKSHGKSSGSTEIKCQGGGADVSMTLGMGKKPKNKRLGARRRVILKLVGERARERRRREARAKTGNKKKGGVTEKTCNFSGDRRKRRSLVGPNMRQKVRGA